MPKWNIKSFITIRDLITNELLKHVNCKVMRPLLPNYSLSIGIYNHKVHWKLQNTIKVYGISKNSETPIA